MARVPSRDGAMDEPLRLTPIMPQLTAAMTGATRQMPRVPCTGCHCSTHVTWHATLRGCSGAALRIIGLTGPNPRFNPNPNSTPNPNPNPGIISPDGPIMVWNIFIMLGAYQG